MTTAVSTTDSNSAILQKYIDSQKTTTTTSTSSSDLASLGSDYNTFLKILTAQLKNQDPTSPMDASEFTQQLVQYSQVEQQINTNKYLTEIKSALNSNGITPLMNYVGSYVEAKSDGSLAVQSGSAKLAYTLPSEATSVKIYVKNSAGKTIATMDGATTKGLNRVVWDGTCDDGTQAADGKYSFTITAKDSAGDTMTLDDIRIIGLVTGIETSSTSTSGSTAVLKLGEVSVSDADVDAVFAGVTASTNSSSSSSSSSSS